MAVTVKKKAGEKKAPVVVNKLDLRRVSTASIKPNDYNPNEMSEELFNALASDLKEEDLDQPIVVRPDPDKEGEWIIVDGEHRWRSALVNELDEVTISVRHYTEEEAMVKTVRRNMIHGELNTGKFNAMIQRLSAGGMTAEKARELMAVDVKKFSKLWKGATVQTAERAEKLIANADTGVQLTAFVANLSQMVREIVQKDGDTASEGYISFMFKGKTHLMVSMDATLQKLVMEYAQGAKEDGKGQKAISQDMQRAFKELLGD